MATSNVTPSYYGAYRRPARQVSQPAHYGLNYATVQPQASGRMAPELPDDPYGVIGRQYNGPPAGTPPSNYAGGTPSDYAWLPPSLRPQGMQEIPSQWDDAGGPKDIPSRQPSMSPASGSLGYRQQQAVSQSLPQYMQDYGGPSQGANYGDSPPQTSQPDPDPYSSGPPQASPVPDVRPPVYTGGDPYDLARNDRQRAVASGDIMNQQLQDRTNQENWWSDYYRNQANQHWNNPASQGYTPEEQTSIMGTGDNNGIRGLTGLYQTGEEEQANYLSPEEQAAMYGNPYAGAGFFNPGALENIQREGYQRQNENLQDTLGRQRSALNPDALLQREGYGRDVQGALAGGEGASRDMLTYGAGNVRGALDEGSAATRGAVDPSRMRMSEDFVNRYRMSDSDVQNRIQEAANTEGNLTRSRQDEVTRAAAASGMNAPLAIATGMNRLQMTGDQQSAQAMLAARNAARQEQAGREKDIESTRLGAEGNYAGLASGNELALTGLRSANERSLTEAGMANEQALAARRLGAVQQQEQNRQQAQQYLTGQQLNTERYGGQLGQQVAENNANAAMNVARYGQETGRQIQRDADSAGTARAGVIAQNRQGATQRNQAERYNRGMDINAAASNRASNVAGTRIGQSNARAGYLAQQGAQANTNVNTGYNQRLQNNQQTNQAANQATGNIMNYDLGRRNSGFMANVNRGIGTAIGNLPNLIGRSGGQRGG